MLTEIKELKKYKGFTPFISARFISNFGNGLSPIALAYGVLSIPGTDGGDLSLVMASRFIPMVAFMIIGGVVGDRYQRNRVVGGADMLGSVFVAVSAMAFIIGSPSIALLVLMGSLFGLLNALFWPAMSGVMPAILPQEKLKAGNSILALVCNFGLILGALIGGIVTTNFGSGWALLIDAFTFFIAGLLLWNLELKEMPVRKESTVFADLKSGWKEFSSRSWVVIIVSTLALVNFCFEAMTLVLGPLAYDDTAHGPRYWSFNLAALTFGMVIGSLLTLKIKFKKPLKVMLILIAISGIWDFALALDAPMYLILICAVISGISVDVYFISWYTTMQSRIPEESYSRVISYDAFGSYAIAPLGILVAGPVAILIGVTNTLLITGGLTMLVSLAALSVKSVRNLPAN